MKLRLCLSFLFGFLAVLCLELFVILWLFDGVSCFGAPVGAPHTQSRLQSRSFRYPFWGSFLALLENISIRFAG